jgi:hypothetical protein
MGATGGNTAGRHPVPIVAPDQGSRPILACHLCHQLGTCTITLSEQGVCRARVFVVCSACQRSSAFHQLHALGLQPWPDGWPGRVCGCSSTGKPHFAPLALCRACTVSVPPSLGTQSGAEPFNVVRAAPCRMVAHSRCPVGPVCFLLLLCQRCARACHRLLCGLPIALIRQRPRGRTPNLERVEGRCR